MFVGEKRWLFCSLLKEAKEEESKKRGGGTDEVINGNGINWLELVRGAGLRMAGANGASMEWMLIAAAAALKSFR
jgi:hypothetical protein